MSDVTIQITDFFTPSRSANKMINKESVKKVINSDRFKTNLEMGRVLGLATHKSRYEDADPNIPMEDQILISPYLANVARKIWIDESKNCLMGDFDLLDTQCGRLIKDLLKKNVMIPVSMSVSATADNNNYYIEDLLGVDFTCRPDLNAKITKVNFSEKDSLNEYERDGKHYFSFSTMLSNDTCKVNFSDNNNDDDGIEICEDCGKPIDECICKSSSYSPIRFEGQYSESTCVRPKVTKIDDKNTVRRMPVKNTDVGSSEVVTNLDVGNVAGEDIENINPENFSLLKSMGFTNGLNLNTTIDEIHKDIPIENQLTIEEITQLPNTIAAAVQYSIKTNFSLASLKQEWNLPPYRIIKKRIDEVIQFCKSSKQEEIDKRVNELKNYFDSYMFTWVNNTISGTSKDFNIALGLRLNQLGVAFKKLIRLNRIIKRMKQELARSHYTTKPIQEELNAAYQDIENDLYAYINKKIKPLTFGE